MIPLSQQAASDSSTCTVEISWRLIDMIHGCCQSGFNSADSISRYWAERSNIRRAQLFSTIEKGLNLTKDNHHSLEDMQKA